MTTSPFDREHADAWSLDFVDVARLNHRTSDAVADAVAEVRSASRRGPEHLHARSLLVLGPAGSGKTHLFARLRRTCGPGAAFVLLRPELAADPTPRLVLAACVDALQRRAMGASDRQLDVVVGSATALLLGPGAAGSAASLDELRRAPETDRRVLIEGAIDRLSDEYPEVAADWLERFLRVPSLPQHDRRAMLTWLSGREPDATQLARLGLEHALPESSVLPALRTLSIVAAHSAPLVLVFDQLENLVDEATGAARIHAHARLVCELHDTVRGLLLVQMALDAEWERRIRPELSASERSRLEARVFALELPGPADRDALRNAWVARIPDGAPPPWPFASATWERWRTSPGITPRQLLIACREAIRSAPDLAPGPTERPPLEPAALDERLAELWRGALADGRFVVDEAACSGRGVDPERIASGVAAAVRLLGGLAEPGGRGPHALRAVMAGATADLFVLQQAHWRSLGAAIARAAGAALERPAVAVREAALAIPPTWQKVRTELQALRARPGAHFIELPRERLVSLLALDGLLSAARSRDLTDHAGRVLAEADVQAWARQALGVASWEPLSALAGGGERQADDEPTEPVAVAARCPPAPAMGTVLDVLSRLGIASVERVVRDVRATDPSQTRGRVIEALRRAPERVAWLGDAIVHFREEGEP